MEFFGVFFKLSLPLHCENTSLFLRGHWSRFFPEGTSAAAAAEHGLCSVLASHESLPI